MTTRWTYNDALSPMNSEARTEFFDVTSAHILVLSRLLA
jgi:hypothetical protein